MCVAPRAYPAAVVPPSAPNTMPTSVAARTTAATPIRLAFMADLPISIWCGAAGCGVLDGPPHERKDANGDRDIADGRGQAVKQGVDVSVQSALGNLLKA